MEPQYLSTDIAHSRIEALVVCELLRETNTTKIFDLPARMLDSRDFHGDLYEWHAPTILQLLGVENMPAGLNALGVDASTLDAYEDEFLDRTACECWALVGAWVSKVAREAAEREVAA